MAVKSDPQYSSFRFQQLDSLRGIAAVTVVISHCLNVYPAVYDAACKNQLWALKHTPLYIFLSGGEAVLFFFVLSGFVLSLPFYISTPDYISFILKRISRIYLPLYSAVLLAVYLRPIVYSGSMPALSDWFNRVWHEPFTSSATVQHLILVGGLGRKSFIPVLWTLVHEMRISLLFPFIMMVVTRVHWGVALSLSCILSVSAFVLWGRIDSCLGYSQDYTETITYIPLFVVGALLAGNITTMANRFKNLALTIRFILLIAGLLLYLSQGWLFSNMHIRVHIFFSHMFIAIGVSMIILSAIGSSRISAILLTKPLLFIGNLSYSLYLLHTITIMVCIHLFYSYIPLWLILIISVIAAIPLSWLSCRFVEQPSITLGRILINKLKRSREIKTGVCTVTKAITADIERVKD
jgi:peptidoglycan/LPS O-acetylase OafA/YrhL